MADFGLFNQQILDTANTAAGLISNPSSIQAQVPDVLALADNEVSNLRQNAQRAVGEVETQITQAYASFDDAQIAQEYKKKVNNALANEFGNNNSFNFAGQQDPGTASGSGYKQFSAIPNPLHAYSTITYNLSLHALDKTQYNNLMDNGKYQAKNVLIATSGRRGDSGLIRQRRWQDDFYFDKLSMESVIGITAKGKGSNVLTIDFTIVEPYGMTLLDRMAQTAKDLGWKNPTEMVYLIQVDFMGYRDEDLEPETVAQTQRKIPIKILKVEADYNQNGSNYKISAVVVSHSGFDNEMMQIQTPVRLGEENGTLELSKILAYNEHDATAVAQSLGVRVETELAKQKQERKEKTAYNNLYQDGSYGGQVAAEMAEKAPFAVKLPPLSKYGLGSILTGYWIWAAETTGLTADGTKTSIPPYIFQFYLADNNISGAAKISDAKLLRDEILNLKNKPAANSSANKEARDADSNAKDDPGINIYFPLFTNVIDIINTLLKCTDYFVRQVEEDSRKKTNNDSRSEAGASQKNLKPLDFFKITPVVTYGPYIPQKRDYQRIVKFYISPYKFYGNRLPFGGQGNPKRSDCVKEYNYLFTGKNIDILDLKVDFNNTFYSFITVNATRLGADQDKAKERLDQAGDGDQKDKPENAVAYQRSIIGGKMNLSPVAKFTVDPTKASENTIRVNDLFNNIYTASKADMLAIDMKILGDPTFIQEEDASFTAITASTGRTNAGRTLKTGSLVFNDGDILAKVNFKFKNDIDTSPLGEGNYTDADKEAGIEARFFTGIYKLLTVQSNFERGVFTQNLNMVRLFNDEDSKRDSGTTAGNPRDTQASLDQITDIAELDWAANQVGNVNTFGPVDPYGGTHNWATLDPAVQKLTSGVQTSVNTRVNDLAGQARDKITEVTQSNKRLVTVDGILQYENLGQPLSQAERTKIWKELTKNAGDDVGNGE